MQSYSMKKALLWLGMGVAVCLLVTGAFYAEKAVNQGAVFADPALEAAVRAKLNQPDGTIRREDVAQLESLDGSHYGITNLVGIEQLKSLKELNLKGNHIRDLTPLSRLEELVELNLRDNQVTDLSPLAKLTKLEKLNLRGNLVRDIGALRGLVRLQDLNLRYNFVADLSPLADLPLTARLYLEGNPIADYGPVADTFDQIADKDFTLKTALPVFSVHGGYYENDVLLTLSTNQKDAVIRYTLDGSTPTEESPVYTEPIRITERGPDEFIVARFTTATNTKLGSDGNRRIDSRVPETVFMGTVVRARVFPADGEPSEVVTHTYFVDPNMGRKYTLPILSIVTDAGNFFDPDIGIYVPGNSFTGNGRNSGNYQGRGMEWERPVHVEFFETDGTRAFGVNAGARMHGHASRSLPQKSLRLYFRQEYGQSWLDYPLFSNQSPDQYKRLIVHNSGNDWVNTIFRDAFMHTLLEDTNLDRSDFRPVIVFINGEYWGIQNLREANDKYSLQIRYGVDPDNLDILEQNLEVREGDTEHYEAMLEFIRNHDLTESENYAVVQTMMDIDNYIDYVAFQIYIANGDWPSNNIRYWRLRTEYDPDAPYGHDGRWRWMVYDTDYGFALPGIKNISHNTLQSAAEPATHWARFLLNRLLRNEEFSSQFANRLADLMNTSFSTERVMARIDEMQAVYEPEIAEHIARWGFPTSVDVWRNNVDIMKRFAEQRPQYVFNQVSSYLKLGGTAKLTVEPSEGGYVMVNSITVDQATPWEGTYFRKLPIQLTAKPKPGYEFVGWSDESLGTMDTIQVTLEQDRSIRPIFKKR